MLKLNGFFAVFGISALIYLMPSAGAEGVVQLASNGKTDYLIVKSGNASAVDDYAVKTLAKYLNQITGAEFPVVDAADVAETSHCIFVGLSGPALKRLGMDDPLGVLKDQEHVCRSKGDNIFLYGKSIHGNLYAVMEFLENSLLAKLLKDVDCDTDAIIKEFTDHMYGPAAPLMRKYMRELEDCRIAMKDLPPGVTYKSQNYDNRTFPYLTPENIHRWETSFDEMEKRVGGMPQRFLDNLRYVRRELDFAVLWKWFDLQIAYPDYYVDHKVFVARIEEINGKSPRPLGERGGEHPLRPFAAIIEAAEKEKPLPEQFDGIDRERIRTFLPIEYTYTGLRGKKDPEAAMGITIPVHRPDAPFRFGFYSNETATVNPKTLPPLPAHSSAIWGKASAGGYALQRVIKAGQIAPKTYRIYRLGEVKVTENSILWFSNKSRQPRLLLGDRLYEAGTPNRWDVFVSLKFEGSAYGGEGENKVWCGRVIVVQAK